MKQFNSGKSKKEHSYFDLLKKLLGNTKDYLFPLFCLGCDLEGVWLCEDCIKKISLNGVWCCPVCHRDGRVGFCCEQCDKKSALERHVAATTYKESSLAGRLISAYKYEYAEDVKSALSRLVRVFLLEYKDHFLDFDMVIPVPLHKRRFAERGYNQAKIISGILADELCLGSENLLKRNRATKQQVKLSRAERLVNVKDAFEIRKEVDLSGKKILLVDDVYTTGSTMNECAKTLRGSGALNVVGFSLARG